MTRASRRPRFPIAVIAFWAIVAFDTALANHFILPCRHECPGPRWVVTGSLATAREWHTATLLPNGKVLVAGGRTSPAIADARGIELGLLDSAELYDPATGTWSAAPRMSEPRFGHTATLLADGRVLVAGGDHPGEGPNYTASATAEIYDPHTGEWTAAGSMNAIRAVHGAVRLRDGRVLVAGGWGDDATNSAEIYDPRTDTWSETGRMIHARYWHTLTLQQDGRVLAARGSDQGDRWYDLTSAEVYDPVSGVWTLLPESRLPSVLHTATLLPDGRVLLAAGEAGTNERVGDLRSFPNAVSELFDAVTGSRGRSGDLLARRAGHAAALLPDGAVLVAGGNSTAEATSGFPYRTLSSAERFDPATGTWSRAAELNAPRAAHTMTVLADGTVLVVGGYTLGVAGALASVERYTFAARPAEGAVPLRDGRTSRP